MKHVKKISVPTYLILDIESLLTKNGIGNVKIIYRPVKSTLVFFEETDYLVFVIKDIMSIKSDQIVIEPDLSFSRRIEKRLRIYTKEDSSEISTKITG